MKRILTCSVRFACRLCSQHLRGHEIHLRVVRGLHASFYSQHLTDRVFVAMFDFKLFPSLPKRGCHLQCTSGSKKDKRSHTSFPVPLFTRKSQQIMPVGNFLLFGENRHWVCSAKRVLLSKFFSELLFVCEWNLTSDKIYPGHLLQHKLPASVQNPKNVAYRYTQISNKQVKKFYTPVDRRFVKCEHKWLWPDQFLPTFSPDQRNASQLPCK